MSDAGIAEIPPAAPTEQLPTRLHITPLNEGLLKVILPTKELQASADPIYNRISTFPENDYGFVTVPAATAQAIKKKYHGAYLRGSKMRVEEARPEKKRKREAEAGVSGTVEKASRRREKKRSKLEEGVLPAVELPEGRHVKRGWTGDTMDKKHSKHEKGAKGSSSGDKGHVVFRTKPPASSAKSKPAAGEADAKKPKATSKASSSIRESERTEHFPSFIKNKAASADSKSAIVFEEGRGWTDESGNLVEAVSSRKSHRKQADVEDGKTEAPLPSEERKSGSSTSITAAEDDASSDQSSELSPSSASSVYEDEILNEDETESQASKARPTTEQSPVDTTKSPAVGAREPLHEPSPASEQHIASEPPPEHSISHASPIASPKPVHPLEALFKRPAAPTTADPRTKRRPPPAPINTAFSFGFQTDDPNDEDAAEDDIVDSSTTAPPQTPFTRQDRFERGIRSAAPTPDTAAIGRRFSWRAFGGRDDDDDDAEGPGEAPADADDAEPRADRDADGLESQAGAGQQEKPEQNEITRIFYEKRGELNKAYKGAKRKARKEQRQAENRRTGVGR